MKIALLTEIINRQSGARAGLEIAKALRACGNEITVFAYGFSLEKEASEELKKAGIGIEIITQNRLLAPLKVAFLLKRGNFKVISFHGTLPFFLGAKFSGLPIVRTYYGTQLDALIDKSYPRKPSLFTRFLNILANFCIKSIDGLIVKWSDKVLAISKYTQKELRELHGVNSDYVYLGASPKNFKTGLRNSNQDISILSVSRIVAYKGFDRLIKIFNNLAERFPKIRLTILGSSPDQKYLAYLKKIAGKRVTIKTDVSDRELIQAYQKTDIYATFDRYLFFGMPILEAASFSIPSVSIARCAALETVQHGHTGYLAENDHEFEIYLEKLVTNSSLRRKMGEVARKKTELFSWESLAQKYLKIFAMTKKEKSLKFGLILTGIIFLGTVLRLAFLNRHAFWFDEAFSYFVASRPFASLIRATTADNNPPLYYLVLKLWLGISREVWFLRFLSLLFGIVTIPILYKVATKLLDRRVGLFASAIFALSPLHVYFSTETRMYSLLTLESLLIFWLFLKIIELKKNFYLLIFTLIGILGLYTHYYFAFILLALNLIFFIQIKRNQHYLFAWIIAQIIIFLALTPWLSLVLQSQRPGCWCFPATVGLPAMFASFAVGGMGLVTLRDFIDYWSKPSLFFFSVLTLLMFLAFSRGIIELRKRSTEHLIIFTFFFTPILLLSFGTLLFPIFSPRALIIISPLYYLLVALGVRKIAHRFLKKFVVNSLFLLLTTVLAFQFFDPFFYGPPIEKAAGFVAQEYKGNEVVLHSSLMTFYSFQYLHRFSYPEVLVTPPDLSQGTIAEIGGKPEPLEGIAPFYSEIWLVDAPYWTRPIDTESIEQELNKDFQLDLRKNYGKIELYHFSRK